MTASRSEAIEQPIQVIPEISRIDGLLRGETPQVDNPRPVRTDIQVLAFDGNRSWLDSDAFGDH
jgi:hypothetical protein